MKVSKKEQLTQAKLKEILNYDPDNGIFTWKKRNGPAGAGSIAGCVNPRNYCRICVNKKSYLAHRLAWLYMYGYFPENQVDHINRVASDNRISNLREVSNQCNTRNSGVHCSNTSGIRGVCWCKKKKKWYARIKIDGKYKYLGSYDDFDEAVCVRLAAEQCVDWAGCNLSSSAYKHVQNMVGK